MIDAELKYSLADCFGFLYILKEINSGIRSYVFIEEHWPLLNKSIRHVLDNENEVSKFLEAVEKQIFQSPKDFHSYIENNLSKKSPEHHFHQKVKTDIEVYFSEFDNSDVFESPVLIHQRIKEVEDEKELHFLFSMYLEHLGSFLASDRLKNMISRVEERTKYIEPYDLHIDGHRLPTTFLKLLKLGEIDLKLNKFLYCFELDQIEYLLIGNIDILIDHCKYIQDKLIKNIAYDNSLDIFQILIEWKLKESINLLGKSNFYNENIFPKELVILVNELKGISNEDLNLHDENSRIDNFRCILFERAKNAFKYSLIDEAKYSKYEEKLKETEHKRFVEVREYLANLIYLVQKNKYPAIREFNWSGLNEDFYQGELKPALEKEEFIGIDFNSGLYAGYFSKYLEDVAIKAYKANDKIKLKKKAEHLIRLYGQYNIESYDAEFIKSILLDARAFKEYESYTKEALQNSVRSSSAIIEVISVQSIKNILPFSGELFLSQVFWERQKKLTELFEDEIISYLNSYIEANDHYDYLLTLLKKYCNTEFVKSNFDKIKKDWTEEFFNIYEDFPYEKHELLTKIRDFNNNGREYQSNSDLYPTRFKLAKEHKFNFDFFKIPRIDIPYAITDLINLELIKLYKKLVASFVEENDLKVGDDRWVSEKYLYYRIRESFPDITIVRHASPTWLGNQHFDIYLPSKNVAVEYNGRQHYEPISYFGGEESFKYRKELDEQKLRVAKENNTVVFIHKYDDEIESTLKEVRRYISIQK